jgi:phosphoglycolate phosphatase-like HAD superfamily hydrolase
LSAEVSLSHLQLREHFDVIDTGSAEGAIKPRQIARVLARWGLAPEHAAYVGDAPSDIDAAREAGVLALAAAWAKTADSLALGRKQPAALFESVADFQTWIARHLP